MNYSKDSEYSNIYKEAGVDTLAGMNLVQSILPFVRKTYQKNVLSDLGGFSAIYDLSFIKNMDEPVLLTSTDGVGTKLTYSSFFKRFDTVGYDLVAMCANDILVSGGKSAIFLDYIATGKLKLEELSLVIRSIASACKMIGCSLMGGETAEHPGVMKEDDFDLAGFMIGFAEKSKLITGENIIEGDIIIGVPSSGIHSNGVSLIRKIYFDPAQIQEQEIHAIKEKDREFIKNFILLQPTILYEPILRDLIDNQYVKGMVHITGGGYPENIPRILKDDLYVELNEWELKTPFKEIAERGNLNFSEMVKVFNCGYGMLLFIDKKNINFVTEEIKKNIKQYKSLYIQTQRNFFSEYNEWEKDWTLPFLNEIPVVLGEVKKDIKHNKKVIFIYKS